MSAAGARTGKSPSQAAGRVIVRALNAAALILIGATAFAQTSPAPYTTGYRYDPGARLVGTIWPDPDGAGAIKYAATRNTYSSLGLLTSVEAGELANWQSEAVLPSAWTGFTVFRITEFTYDSAGRKLTEKLSAGGTAYALTQFSYDSYGRFDCVAIRMNTAAFGSLPSSACTLGTEGTVGPDRITRYTYDAKDRMLTEVRAYGTSVQQTNATYTRTGSGAVTSITDARGNYTSLDYDGFMRLKSQHFPSKTTTGVASTTDYEQYGYDDNGDRTTARRRDGQTITYYYDNLRRLIRTQYPAGTIADVYRDYDLRNLQLYARFGSTTGPGITTTYDGFGQVASSSTNQSGAVWTLSYQYDADGDRTQVTYPGGSYFTYQFDGLDRLSVIKESGTTTLVAVTYDTQGRRSNLARGSGVTSTTYGYDGISRLQTLTQNLDGSGTTNDETRTFSNNPASQIITRQLSNSLYAYPVSNSANKTYTVNGLNQYTQITQSGSVSPTYDDRGNLTADGISGYSYDIENRLLSATTLATGTTKAILTYNPLGRLYQVTSGGVTTRFLYDGDSLVAEYDGSGNVLRRYVHGDRIDEPLVWYEGSTVGAATRRYLHADHLGSITAIAGNAGATLEVERYDPYGVPGIGNTSRFQYTGQIRLPEIGLFYYKARFYDATLGRFLQTDPVGYESDLNIYAYVGNDPTNGIDPTGHDCRNPASSEPCERIVVTARRDNGPTFEDWQVLLPFTMLGTLQDYYTSLLPGYLQSPVSLAMMVSGPGELEAEGRAIKIAARGLRHVLQRHFPGGRLTRAASIFNKDEDAVSLVKAAEAIPPTVQSNGNYVRIVNAGREVGVDVTTGRPTSVYTVVTSSTDDLVTMHPGLPRQQ